MKLSIALRCIIIFSSTLSVAGSITIIVMARHKMEYMYHRLVSILSVAEIMFALSTIMQAFLIPAGQGFLMAMGSHTSCTAIGFLFMWGSLFSPLYNCILCVYFSLRVRNYWREKELLWRFEIPSHVLAATVPLILPIAGLITNSYAVSFTIDLCTYAAYPTGCFQDDEMECERGEFSRYLNLANSCIVLIISLVGIIATVLVYWRVRWQLKNNIKYKFGKTTATMDEEGARQLRELKTHAILFGMIFLNDVIWPCVSIAVFYGTEGSVRSQIADPKFFLFLFFCFLLYPLQGALNLMVYLRPTYFEWRRAFPDYSRFTVIKNVIRGENIDRYIQIARHNSQNVAHQIAEEKVELAQEVNVLHQTTEEEHFSRSFAQSVIHNPIVETIRSSTSDVRRSLISIGTALDFASTKKLRHNREVVLACCLIDGTALQQASHKFRRDKEIVLAACNNRGQALEYASKKLRQEKEVVLVACKQHGISLQYASKKLQSDKEIVLAACTNFGAALQWASRDLQNDREIVLAACNQNGLALEWASKKLQSDKDVVLHACRSASALQHASDELRCDKEVVIAAATSQPESLKYALGGLNQDPDCLVAARIWLPDSHSTKGPYMETNVKIVLSTRFSLGEDCSSNATQFTVKLQKHPYILHGHNGKKFDVYSPNAFAKDTCDPKWTRLTWPCRGTYETCRKEASLKVGIPKPDSCWRYSFRYQQQLALHSKGFMIQVVDYDSMNGHELGQGQLIETEMASDMGLKIFRVNQPTTFEDHSESNAEDNAYIPFGFKKYIPFPFRTSHINKLITRIEQWYSDDCEDKTICEIVFRESDET